MNNLELLSKARCMFDRFAAEKRAEFAERLGRHGYTPAEIDAIFVANEPNLEAAWRATHRLITIKLLLLEAKDG